MKILSIQEIGTEAWDAFCMQSHGAWLRHTTRFIALAVTIAAGKNVSFGLVDEENTLIAIQPLVVQTSDEQGKEFAMGGFPTPFSACALEINEDERDRALSLIFAEIDRLARIEGVTSSRFGVEPLSEIAQPIENPFLVYGCTDASIMTSIIHLDVDSAEVKAGIAKGHRSDIIYAEKQGYEVDILNGHEAVKIFPEFKNLYFKAAGRIVGTPERWEVFRNFVAAGEAILVLGRMSNNSEYVAGNLLLSYKSATYYMLSATLPDQRHRGLGALMQWRGMQYLREKSIVRYEMGWMATDADSPKEQAIAQFKKLFGGELVTFWQGERLYGISEEA